jgi:hypothetical protein
MRWPAINQLYENLHSTRQSCLLPRDKHETNPRSSHRSFQVCIIYCSDGNSYGKIKGRAPERGSSHPKKMHSALANAHNFDCSPPIFMHNLAVRDRSPVFTMQFRRTQ